jgi:hypothetical protein
VATWWSPFVDGPPGNLAPAGINKMHPSALNPDLTTRALGDSRSVQHNVFRRNQFHRHRMARATVGGFAGFSPRAVLILSAYATEMRRSSVLASAATGIFTKRQLRWQAF